MKIAVTGKGGVGKTTFAAVLARLYAEEGRTVLTADVDPDSNLGLALGFSPEELTQIVPISKMRELIAERTGSGGDGLGKFFRINPKVDDIPEKFAREKNGVRLLVMGTVETGGAGCVCPEHVVLRRLISHLVIQRDEVVIMDMEAGLEHLGRGTADSMDRFIVVVEPGARSIQTYHQIKKLAGDLGVKKVSVIANKVHSGQDEEFLRREISAQDLLGMIHYLPEVAAADRDARSPYDAAPSAVEEIRKIKQIIDNEGV